MARVVLAAILLFTHVVSATPGLQDYLESRDLPTARTRNTENCGFYLAPKGRNLFYRNATGYVLGDLDTLRLQQELQMMIQEVGIENMKGTLVLAGLPMWTNQARQRVSEVNRLLRDMNLKDIRLLPMYQRRTGVGRVERWTDFFTGLSLLPQDMEVPTLPEVGLMTMFVFLEIPAAGYYLANFEPKIAIPLITNHFILLVSLGLFRRTVTNWAERSDSKLEKSLKYGTTGLLYVLNSNVMSKWPAIAAGIHQEGLWHYEYNHLRSAIGHFLFTQGQAITLGASAIEYEYFIISGVIQDEKQLSRSLKTSTKGQTMAVVRTGAYYAVNGPILAIASTSTKQLIHGVPINLGQALLIGLAGGAAVYYRWSKTRKVFEPYKPVPLLATPTLDDDPSDELPPPAASETTEPVDKAG
jgi:hypothetical protein